MSLQQVLQGHTGKAGWSIGLVENLLIGATAAVSTKTVTAPLDRMKLLLQCQEELIRHSRLRRPYFGLAHCQLRTIDREGVAAFWKGNLINCLRYVPTQMLTFTLKDTIQANLTSLDTTTTTTTTTTTIGTTTGTTPTNNPTFATNFVAGAAAGAASLALFYPLDLARNRIVLDAKMRQQSARLYAGIGDVYATAMRKHGGVRGLYRGLAVSLVGVAVYRGCYFGFYDTLKPIVLGDQPCITSSFGLAYLVTVAAGTISYPIDSVRRRLMITSASTPNTPIAKGAVDCLRRIVKLEGWGTLMTGSGVNALRAVTGAYVLVAFDQLKGMYVNYRLG